MGLMVPTVMHAERDDQPLPYEWFVGIDWSSEQHQICVLDRDRRRVGERVVDHDGASLAQLAAWLWTLSAGQPGRVAVAITPCREPRMTGVMRWSWLIPSVPINPVFIACNSMSRHSYCYELLRELSRAEETLLEEFRRSANRLRDQLHRFDPQMLELCHAADEPWWWDPIDLAPTPAHAALLSDEQVQRLLKRPRIQRVKAEEVLVCLPDWTLKPNRRSSKLTT